MRKIITVVAAFLLMHSVYSQKIRMINVDTAFKVMMKGVDSATKDSVTLFFELSGSSKDSIKINLKIIPQAPGLIVKANTEILFTKDNWPDSVNNTKIVIKKIVVETKPVQNIDQKEILVEIKPDSAGPNKDKIKNDAGDRVLIHFNRSGLINESLKFDPSNTLKTDFSFYTDFLGVDDERPNGLYQLELGFKVPINRYKCVVSKNAFKQNSYIQFLRSFYFNINMMNIDNLFKNDVSDNSAKPITKTDSTVQLGIDTVIKNNNNGSGGDTSFNPIYANKKLINSFDLYQWASFAARFKLNVIAFRLQNHHIYLGYNVGYLRTPVYDSIVGKRIHVGSIMHGPDFFYETDFKVGSPMFNIRVLADYYFLKLWNNDLEQVNAPVFKYNTQTAYKSYYEPTDVARIFDLSFRVAYVYNADSKNNGNQVFIRLSNSIQCPTVNGVKFHNSFTQIQFGGVFDLTTILKKAPSAPTGENAASNSGNTATGH